jgi:hypothetical protein
VELEQRERESSVSEREFGGLNLVAVVVRGKALVTEQSLVNDIPPEYNFVRMPRTLGAIILASLLLPACHRHPPVEDPSEYMKVEEWQKAQAIDAANGLREVFNNSACEPIYTAAAAHFRSQNSVEWTRECERLKKDLGTWRSFQITYTGRCALPGVVVCVGGTAEFEKGHSQIDLAWLLNTDGAQLFWLALKKGDGRWLQLPPRPFLYRLIDPMPIKAIQNGRPS